MTLLVFIGVQKGIRPNYSDRNSGTIRRVIIARSLKACILLTAILLFFIIARAITLMDYIIKVDVFLILGLRNVWLILIKVFVMIITDEDLILARENQ